LRFVSSSLADIHTRVSTQRQPRARAVADAPVQALLDRAEQLAQSWALALIAGRPLAEVADLPLAELARTAPELCATISRALASDAELERLASGERGAPAQFSRAPVQLVADLDVLRSILWEALLAELRDPPARLLADLADRLSHACSVVLVAALHARRDEKSPPDERIRTQGSARERTASVAAERRVIGRSGAVLVDETADEPRPLAASDELEQAPRAPERSRPAPQATPHPRPWDTPLGGEPMLRVRRGPEARLDDRG
jgi:hypothetical protein